MIIIFLSHIFPSAPSEQGNVGQDNNVPLCSWYHKEVGTTVHAVSFHMKNIYEKLEVHSKSEAVARALRDRIVT